MSAGPELPPTMRALATTSDGSVALVERPVPTPRAGQVLVRMRAAPVNPNDLMFLAGAYEVKKPAGAVAGFEGSGVVVATGGGWTARYLLGRNVACAAGDGDGTWAQYACVDAMRCAPLDRSVSLEQGATLLTNPMTATVLLETARRGGHRAFVHNAAAGSLGRMLLRLGRRHGLGVVNVVRRPEQAAMLRALGAEHVVDATAPGADDELRDRCGRLGVRLAFDAVAGSATEQLARALQHRGRVVVYGMLSGAPCALDAHTLIFGGLRVDGFTMFDWLRETTLLAKLRALRAAQQRVGDDLRTDVRATLPLDEHAAALALARGATSDGKVLFVHPG